MAAEVAQTCFTCLRHLTVSHELHRAATRRRDILSSGRGLGRTVGEAGAPDSG